MEKLSSLRNKLKSPKVAFEIKATWRQVRVALALLAVICLAWELGSETVTFSTTYPSPVGIYARIITTGGKSGTPMDTVLGRNTGNVILTPAATNPNGSVGIGTASPSAKAKLDVDSTQSGFLPPRMNAVQRDAIPSPPEGLQIYNTDSHQMEVWNGTAWTAIASGGQAWGGFKHLPDGTQISCVPKECDTCNCYAKAVGGKIFIRAIRYDRTGPPGCDSGWVNQPGVTCQGSSGIPLNVAVATTGITCTTEYYDTQLYPTSCSAFW